LIAGLEQRLIRLRAAHAKELREVRYFRSLLVFPGARVRSDIDHQPDILYTRADLARMLSELLANDPAPQVADCLQAAIAIVHHRYPDAGGPLRHLTELTHEPHPLFQCQDLRSEIRNREEKIDELRAKVAGLGKRYDKMMEIHERNVKQYVAEAKQNEEVYIELLAVQHEKEAKDAEASRLHDFEITKQGLQQEIKIMEAQRIKVESESTEKAATADMERNRELKKMMAEIADLESERGTVARANDQIHQEIDAFEERLNLIKRERLALQKVSSEIQDDLENCIDNLRPLQQDLDEDPEDNEEFRQFLSDLSDRRIKWRSWHPLVKRMGKAKDRLKKYQEHLDKWRHKLENIEREMRSREKKMLHMSDDEETAIIIRFLEPVLNDGVLDPGDVEVYFVVTFEKLQRIRGRVAQRFFFVPRNDAELAEYLRNSGPRVDLCTQVGDADAVVGSGIIGLGAFVNGENAIRGKVNLRAGDEPIGEVQYDALLYKNLQG
jgi:hypothetical protein